MKDRYEEALALARQGKSIEEIFPELRESEDERVRKTLFDYFDWVKHRDCKSIWNNLKVDDILAWLEKQKEQKPISFNEPYNPDDYEVVMEGNATGLKRKEQKPVEGDNETEMQRVFREGKSAGRKEVFDRPEEYGLCKPVEWSEEDEANFKWFDKLFRAESVVIGGKDIPQDKYLWFKSLRPSWKPDNEKHDYITPHKKFFQWIYDRLVNVHGENPDVDYMKSFKERINSLSFDEQPHWTPSAEQMDALKYFVNHHQGLANQLTTKWDDFDELKSLYEDLKHLYINSKKWKR